MALPTQISTQTINLSYAEHPQPFISSSGNVYVFTKSGAGTYQMYKASDPTSSFSTVGSSLSVASTKYTSSVTQNGDILYIAYGHSAGVYLFAEFDMSSDSYNTSGETIEDTSGMNTPSKYSISIEYRGTTNDELVVVLNGITDAIMGTSYERVDAYHKNKASSSWTGPIAVDDDTTEVSYSTPVVTLGTSNGVHIVYDVAGSSGPIRARTLNSSNSLSTAVSSSSNYDGSLASSTPLGSCFSFDDSGTQRIRTTRMTGTGSAELMMLVEDGSNNASWEGTEVKVIGDTAPNAGSIRAAWETGTTLHSIFSRAGTSQTAIWYDTSTDGGTTWGTDTNIYEHGSTFSTQPNCNIYTRSGTKYLAYVFNLGTSGTYYNEYSLASGSTTNKNLNYTGTGTVTLDLLPGKLFAIVSSATPSLTKQVILNTKSITATGSVTQTKQVNLLAKAFSAVGTASLATSRLFMQALNYTATGTASLLKQVGITKAITATGSASLSLIKSFVKTLTYTATATTSLVKQAQITKAITATGTAALSTTKIFMLTLVNTATGAVNLTKHIVLTAKTFTATGTSSLTKLITLTVKSITATATASLTKTVQLATKAITATGTATLSATKVFLLTLLHSAVGTASLATASTFLKSFTVVSTAAVSMTKQITKTLTYVATGTASQVKKVVLNTKSIVATGIASASQTLVYLVNPSIIATGTVSLDIVLALKAFIYTATGTVSLTTINNLTKTLVNTATGAVSLIKSIGKVISNTATGTVSLTKKVILNTFSSTATGTSSVSTNTIPGGGGDPERPPPYNPGGKLWRRFFARGKGR